MIKKPTLISALSESWEKVTKRPTVCIDWRCALMAK